MANTTLKVRNRIATKTAAEWKTENPILLKGEMGYDSTSKRYKIGDGTTAWNKLKYDIDLGVVSKGQQLIINGNGVLGDNTNFSQMTYDPTISFNGSPGVFTSSYAYPLKSDEFIPIDCNKRYKLSLDIQSIPDTISTYNYMMIIFYDIDKKEITANEHKYFAGSTTKLARDLNPGDTEIYVDDLSGWAHKTQTYERKIIFWDYKNSYGYQYPKETYSKYWKDSLWTEESQLDYVNNKIILNSPWNKEPHLAGCDVSQGSSGTSYKYLQVGNVSALTHWQGYIQGFDYSGNNVGNKFPPGTAFAKFGMLLNHNKVPNVKVAISNIRLEEVTEDLRYPLTLFNRTYNGTTPLSVVPSDVVGAMEDGSVDITDNTEFITSNANGFNYSGSVNVPYRRKATYVWEWIKSKLNFNIIKGTANREQISYGDLWSTDMSNPFDNSKIKELNESCLKNIPLNAVNFYVSFDEGENWIDFFTLRPDITKSKVIGYVFNNSKDGKGFILTSSFNDDRNKWLRIEINFAGYAYMDHIYSLITFCSTNGINNPMLHVFGFKNSNYTNGYITINEGWTEILNKRFTGWSGWNSYYLQNYVWGTTGYCHFSKMAIEFRGEGFSNVNYKYGPGISRLFMFAKTIHTPFSDNKSDIYLSYDGTMEFPNKTISKGYSIKNGTASQVLLANGSYNSLKTIGGNALLGTGDIAFKTINNQALIGSGNMDTTQDWVNIQNYETGSLPDNNLYTLPFVDPLFITDGSFSEVNLLGVCCDVDNLNKITYNPILNILHTNIGALDGWGKLVGNTDEDPDRFIYLADILNFFLDDKDNLINDNNTNKTWLKTLTANSTPTKSISTMISEGIAKVVANAPASFDTLKEIADWISTHQNDASAMNTAINTNTTNITNLTTKVNTNTTDITSLTTKVNNNTTAINVNANDIKDLVTIVNNLNTAVKELQQQNTALQNEINALKSQVPMTVAEEGFYVVDSDGNIGFKVDQYGATDSATTIETTNLDE